MIINDRYSICSMVIVTNCAIGHESDWEEDRLTRIKRKEMSLSSVFSVASIRNEN